MPRVARGYGGMRRGLGRLRYARMRRKATPGGSGSWKGKGRDKDDESELVRSLRERVRELELEAGFQGA